MREGLAGLGVRRETDALFFCPLAARAVAPARRHNRALSTSARAPPLRRPPPLHALRHADRTAAAFHGGARAATCPGGAGPEVWIKRDDMLGLFPGGNKTRKLEFLVADALAQGADTLVTCGAPQSNHCRITLAAAVKEGLKCRFVIEERVPDSYDADASGNNFMFRLMGVEAITVVPGGSNMAAAMQKVADALAREGRKGYIIPGGGSNALGGLGYVACAQELQQQLLRARRAHRPRGRRLGQLGHARRAARRLPGQPHRHPRSSASASAATRRDQEPLVLHGSAGGAGPAGRRR